MPRNDVRAVPDDEAVAAVDPASEALRYHLDALAELRSATGSRLDTLRADLPSARHRRRDAELAHITGAFGALADRLERVARWQADDHRLVLSTARIAQENRDQIATLDDRVAELSARNETSADHVARLQTQVAQLQDEAEFLKGEIRRLRREPARVESAAATATRIESAETPREAIASAHSVADDFYRDLEHEFRGSRARVKELLSVHVDIVRPAPGPVLDIGCGRGEWLELLADEGITAYGVDINPGFVAENVDRGLDVRVADAITHLAELPTGSLGAITSFHVAEHLPTAMLLDLIDHAADALAPGGALILETPNPTNVRVGAAQFWIDPTHLKPLHPELLAFMLRQRGFTDVKIELLHPGRHNDTNWAEALGLSINDDSPGSEILQDVRDALTCGQDYVVVGWSTAGPSTDSPVV